MSAAVTVLCASYFLFSRSTGDANSLRNTVVAMAVALTGILWIPVLTDRFPMPLPLARPLALQAAGYTLFFVIPAVEGAMNPEADYWHVTPVFPLVLGILGVSYCLLVVGYSLPLGSTLGSLGRRVAALPNLDFRASAGLMVLLMCYLIGWSARIVSIANDAFYHTVQGTFRYGGWGNIVGQLEWLCKISTIGFIARYLLYPKIPGARAVAIVIAATEIAVNGFGGNRQQVGEVLFYAFFLYLLVRGRLPRLTLALLPLLIVSFILMGEFRDVYARYYKPGGGGISDAIATAGASFQYFLTNPAELVNGLQSLNHRNSDITSVASIIRDTPSAYDYEYGRTYLGIALFAVPRVLWPAKPSLVIGFETTLKYFPGADPYNYASSPTTLFGEFYLNFGIMGCLAGMFLWGMFLKCIYVYAQPFDHRKPVYLCLYMFGAEYMFWVSQTAGVIVALLRMWCVLWVMGALARSKRGKTSLCFTPPDGTWHRDLTGTSR